MVSSHFLPLSFFLPRSSSPIRFHAWSPPPPSRLHNLPLLLLAAGERKEREKKVEVKKGEAGGIKYDLLPTGGGRERGGGGVTDRRGNTQQRKKEGRRITSQEKRNGERDGGWRNSQRYKSSYPARDERGFGKRVGSNAAGTAAGCRLFCTYTTTTGFGESHGKYTCSQQKGEVAKRAQL